MQVETKGQMGLGACEQLLSWLQSWEVVMVTFSPLAMFLM